MSEEVKKPEVVVEKEEKEDANFSEKWFLNPEVLYLKPEDQREVTLNTGYEKEWFRKTYLNKGELVLTKRIYNSDLPRNLRGKIVAVTAAPVIKRDEFRKMAEKQPYMSLQKFLKPKPLGTFYELFKGEGGYTQWVNPVDYAEEKNRHHRRQDKKVRGPFTKGQNRPGKPKGRTQPVVEIKQGTGDPSRAKGTGN